MKSRTNRMKKWISMLLISVLLVGMLPGIRVQAGVFFPAYKNTFKELRVPTQVTKIADTYYLCDTYHNQVLYSKAVGVQPKDWYVMCSGLNQPHAVAGDGSIFLVTDTENHRVISYQKQENGFQELQIFEHIGVRPHYVVYDETSGLFYVWSSMTGTMYLFRHVAGTDQVVPEKTISVKKLYGKYVRSFTIEGDQILLPCVDDHCIYSVDKNTFAVKACYPVAPQLAGMVQVLRIQNYYYLTVSTDAAYDQSYASIVRSRTLDGFVNGKYEDINKPFGGDGAPYYISQFDNAYYTPVLREKTRPCIVKFDVAADQVGGIVEMGY